MDKKKLKTVSTTHFYNAIAPEYDQLMGNQRDTMMRRELAEYFKNQIEPGRVLDFGGGTGLDLQWLLESGYTVYFCEPAIEMKLRAEKLVKEKAFSSSPIFLESEKTDFRFWKESDPPFEGELNAVLANFGVLNYVEDLPLLFEKFHLLLSANGSIIASLLYASPRKLFTKYFKGTIKAWIRGEKIKTGSQHEGKGHETFLYSVSDIQNAAKKYFVLQATRSLGNSDFLLFHLVKR